MSARKVLVISKAMIGGRVAGPGIRYWNMARVLAAEHAVTLAVPAGSEPPAIPGVLMTPYDADDPGALPALAARAEVLIAQPDVIIDHPALANSRAIIVVDAYDPVLAEWLEMAAVEPLEVQQQNWIRRLSRYRQAYVCGDAFLCASERQRLWLLGALEALGRVNPLNRAQDPAFHALVMVAPFGLTVDAPDDHRADARAQFGLAPDDRLVLWNGGIWPWLDAAAAVRAMQHVAAKDPSIKLVFPGTRSPDPDAALMNTRARSVMALADALGLTGRSVFFGDWVPYSQWQSLLREADLAITLHGRDTLESLLAFRTRVLDCIAAGLPMLLSGQDVTAQLVDRHGIGAQLIDPDEHSVAEAIIAWVRAPRAPMQPAFETLRAQYDWTRALAPLLQFCRAPRHSADRFVWSGGENAANALPDPGEVRQLRARVRALEAIELVQSRRIEHLNGLVRRYEAGRFISMMRTLHQLTRRLHRAAPPPAPATEALRYAQFLNRHEPDAAALGRQREEHAAWKTRPLVSVLIDAHAGGARLAPTLSALAQQSYTHWEALVCGDAPARAAFDASGLDAARARWVDVAPGADTGARLNTLLNAAGGAWFCALPCGDVLRPAALHLLLEQARQSPAADLIYGDEDCLAAGGRREQPYLKPDWSPDLLLSQHYIGPAVLARTAKARQIGGFRSGTEPDHLWDFALRYSVSSVAVAHVDRVICSRAAGASPPRHGAPGWLAEALAARGLNATIEPNARHPGHMLLRHRAPANTKVSVVICTKDRHDMLARCLTSIFEKTAHPHFEVIVVDNGSVEPETQALFDTWSRNKPAQFRVLPLPMPFNYSALNNHGARAARGDVLILLNNDTEVISPEWMGELAAHAMRPDIGAVGAMLLYPNGTIQHAGVIARIGEWAGHAFRLFPADAPGYFGRLLGVSEFSSVTGACLAVRRQLFLDLGGLDEQLAVTCNDTEFCWRALHHGHRALLLPHIRLTHYESISRGYSTTEAQHARDRREMAYARLRWPEIWDRDPYYHLHLSHTRTDFTLEDPE